MTPKRSLLVIVGSTRPGRLGIHLGEWIAQRAPEHSNFEATVADLKEIDLRFMDEPKHPRLGLYEHDHTKRWSETVKAADAIVIVTPEYNHSFPAPVKNALDYLWAEWQNKAVGIASYSVSNTGGVRAAEALIPVVTQLGMHPTVAKIALPNAAKVITEDGVEADEGLEKATDDMLLELGKLTEQLRAEA